MKWRKECRHAAGAGAASSTEMGEEGDDCAGNDSRWRSERSVARGGIRASKGEGEGESRQDERRVEEREEPETTAAKQWITENTGETAMERRERERGV